MRKEFVVQATQNVLRFVNTSATMAKLKLFLELKINKKFCDFQHCSCNDFLKKSVLAAKPNTLFLFCMIHPHTELRLVSPEVGYGVFATAFIPKGSMVYVKDSLEVEVTPEAYVQFSAAYQEVVEKYSYRDERGVRILSWDLAKYVNHCCQCNTISTGYGFEVALRDIQPGEEITDEYGIFNLEYEMPLRCAQNGCRKLLRPQDFDHYYPIWDEKIKEALQHFSLFSQPLMDFMDEDTKRELLGYLAGERPYRSVYALKHRVENGVGVALPRVA